ncbi:MAG: LysM peptidoglycan-binding domain-containing protein [Thermoguttaceae bacterium]|jgi:nucleoid-associated protein YgaU
MTKKKNSEEMLEPFAAPLPGDPETANRPARGHEVKIGLAVLALMLATVGYVVATQIFSADEAAEAVAEDGLGAEEDSGNVFASLSADHIPAVVRPEAEPQASPLLSAQWNAVADVAKKVREVVPPIPSVPPMPSPAAATALAGWNAGTDGENRGEEQAGQPGTSGPPSGAAEVGNGLAYSPPADVDAAVAQPAMASSEVAAPATVEPPPLPADASALGSGLGQPIGGSQNPDSAPPSVHPGSGGPLPATLSYGAPMAEVAPVQNVSNASAATSTDAAAPQPTAASQGSAPRWPIEPSPPHSSPLPSKTPVEYVGLSEQDQAGAAPAPHAWQQPVVTVVDGKYTASPNDNFYTIARKVYGSGAYFRALAQHNRDKYPEADSIRIGDVIAVPPVEQLEARFPALCPKPDHRDAAKNRSLTAAAQPLRGGRVYVVQEGDTLFDIARYELGSRARVAELIDMNREVLGNQINYLTPGMKLRLPDEVDRSPAVTQRPAEGSLR